MVGNDIVDLSDPDGFAGARHCRFDARVFAPAELETLTSSADPERMRWILWSAKESAYKAARQLRAATVFSPARFVVRLDRWLRGCVWHEGQSWPVRIDLRGTCIHAVVSGAGGDTVCGTSRLEQPSVDAASRGARELALAQVAAWLRVPGEQLRIVRTDRIPRLVVAGRSLAAQLSLAHHGSYVGFACRLGAASGRAR